MEKVTREHLAGLELVNTRLATCLTPEGYGAMGRLIARASAAPEQQPVAYLHQVVCGDAEPDQALSFEADCFPLSEALGYRSLSHVPLFTHGDSAELERLRAECTRLGNQRDAILLQARVWAGEAKAQQSITREVGDILGGIPSWGPIAAGVEALRAEVETLKSQPAGVAVPEGYSAGVNAVAAMIDQKAEAYAFEFGHDDMGGLSFGQGDHAQVRSDYHQSLLELADEARAMLAAAPHPVSGEPFQARVLPWLLDCFGQAIADDKTERNHRFLEEALELVQSCGCTEDEAHKLVSYVYGRAVGERSQEVGGVMVTLAALCLAQRLDMHQCGEAELARITQPAMVEKIREKQKRKPSMSPLPGSYGDREPFVAPPAAKDVSGLSELIDDVCEWFELSGLHGVKEYMLLKSARLAQQGGRPS